MTVCPKCNGRGTVGYFHIDHFVDIECDRCNGSGEVSEVEMTNEEWLRQANTEQVADVIADFYLLGYTHGHNQMDITSRTKWTEWLKEIHHG